MKGIKNLEYIQGNHRDNQGIIITGQYNKYCDFNGAIYYKEINHDLYNGYIYVEVGYSYINKKYYLQDAYLDLKGNGIYLMEQKHFPRTLTLDTEGGSSLYFDTVEEALPLMQKAIKYLENYLNNNWLENKPLINKDIIHHKTFGKYVFEYNNNKYIVLINSDLAKEYLINKNNYIQGNELYKIAI